MSMAERIKTLELSVRGMAARLDAIEQTLKDALAEVEDDQPERTVTLDGIVMGAERDEGTPL